jgi:F-type H+-transporting ATPase subunit delta
VARKAYARRYAQAVFEMALEGKELEKWQADLQKMASAVSDAAFLAVLESPKIKLDDKIRLLSESQGDISPMALNLVRLLITRGSIGMIGAISEEYQRLLDSYHGIETAEVITAVPLDDREMQKVTAKLGALVGKKVVLKSRVDASVIGGIVARVGGKLLDGSTRSQLAALKKGLVSAGGGQT